MDFLTRRGHRSYEAREGFAEWFATEFGLRRGAQSANNESTPLTEWIQQGNVRSTKATPSPEG
ncbi:hypothetical protein [Desmospora profundinema]|uniref:Uncharacterized protein n=1 Tax=Desmospora profundinema TaxID=1571184 RepID=A0ABU1IHC6_9BACL|nr:hypothetical protein [Desmospora profundinema]MDR6224171.1 hypothetical protein [Desmospora profundinema]